MHIRKQAKRSKVALARLDQSAEEIHPVPALNTSMEKGEGSIVIREGAFPLLYIRSCSEMRFRFNVVIKLKEQMGVVMHLSEMIYTLNTLAYFNIFRTIDAQKNGRTNTNSENRFFKLR